MQPSWQGKDVSVSGIAESRALFSSEGLRVPGFIEHMPHPIASYDRTDRVLDYRTLSDREFVILRMIESEELRRISIISRSMGKTNDEMSLTTFGNFSQWAILFNCYSCANYFPSTHGMAESCAKRGICVQLRWFYVPSYLRIAAKLRASWQGARYGLRRRHCQA